MNRLLYIFLFALAVSTYACRDREEPYENPESPADDANDWKNDDYDNDTAVMDHTLVAPNNNISL